MEGFIGRVYNEGVLLPGHFKRLLFTMQDFSYISICAQRTNNGT